MSGPALNFPMKLLIGWLLVVYFITLFILTIPFVIIGYFWKMAEYGFYLGGEALHSSTNAARDHLKRINKKHDSENHGPDLV